VKSNHKITKQNHLDIHSLFSLTQVPPFVQLGEQTAIHQIKINIKYWLKQYMSYEENKLNHSNYLYMYNCLDLNYIFLITYL